jgi:hypothetical protein
MALARINALTNPKLTQTELVLATMTRFVDVIEKPTVILVKRKGPELLSGLRVNAIEIKYSNN